MKRVGALGRPYEAIVIVPRFILHAEPGRVVSLAEAYRYVAIVDSGIVVCTIHAQHKELNGKS